MNRTANPKTVSPEMQKAIKALRRIGYAVGQPMMSEKGHLLVTVGGKLLREEELLNLVQEI